MSRIGVSINGYEQFLLTHLARVNQASLASSFRISTGKYVNSPKDDPSAFLQIQSFENQLSLVNDIQANVQVATTVGAESQVAIDEIRSQLQSVRETLLLDEDGALTADQRNLNQSLIDSAIAAIRTAARTSVNGKRFLDGSHNYTFSGKDPTQIANIAVFSLSDDATISGSVSSAATQASVSYTGLGGRINGSATFTLTGNRGAATISVVNNELLTAARDRINAESHNTGITASVAGNDLVFATVDYGAEATIDVNATSGTFNTSGSTAGADAVVTINGQAVSSSAVDGNVVTYTEQGVHIALELAAGFTGAFSSVTISDDSVARFSLSTRAGDVTKFALPSLFPEVLGGVSGNLSQLESNGSLSGLSTNTSAAIRVVDEALSQLNVAEGRVQAFADIAVASAGRLVDDLATELEASIDAINKVDEDAESLELSHYQSLAENTVTSLAILHEQRSYVFSLLSQIADL